MTIPVPSVDDWIARVEEASGKVIEPKIPIPGIGWFAACAGPGGLLVEWDMRDAWRSVLFADEDTQAKAERDTVAPAKRSEKALQKIAQRTLEDGTPVHSFPTLLQELSTIVRNTCVTRDARAAAHPFQMVTTPSAAQHRALKLLETISV